MSELAAFLDHTATIESDVSVGQSTRKDTSGGIDRRDDELDFAEHVERPEWSLAQQEPERRFLRRRLAELQN